MEVTFIRHGSTNSYSDGFIETQFDYELNEKGKRQCERSKFVCDSFDRVYSSPFKSAMQTARLIYPYMDYIKEYNLSRGCLGGLDGESRNGYDYDYLRNVRDHIIVPKNAESAKDIINRLEKFFEKLRRDCKVDDKVLIVTHLDILKLMRRHYFHSENEKGLFQNLPVERMNITYDNGSLSRCKYRIR